MTESATESTMSSAAAEGQLVEGTGDHQLIDEDLLVEDVSIDGMCGVY